MRLLWRFISISIIVVVSATSVFCGCGEDTIEADDEQLLAKYPLLNLDDPISIWWEGTPGTNHLHLNTIDNDQMYQISYYIRNNIDDVRSISINDIYRNEITKIKLDPNEIKKSQFSFIPQSYYRYDFNYKKQLDEIIQVECEDLDKLSLSIATYSNDPKLDLDWQGLSEYEQLDCNEEKPQTLVIRNNSSITKEIEVLQTRREYYAFRGGIFDVVKSFSLYPGEEVSYSYNLFRQKDLFSFSNYNEFKMVIKSGNFVYYKNVFIDDHDCYKWSFEWTNNATNKKYILEIDTFETKRLKINITNHCNRRRILKPEFFDTPSRYECKFQQPHPYIIKTEKEEYIFDPLSTQEITLIVKPDINGGFEAYEKNEYSIDLLEKYKKHEDKLEPLTLTIVPKFTNSCIKTYELSLPYEMVDKDYYFFPEPYNDQVVITKPFCASGYDILSDNTIDPLILFCFDINSGEKLWSYEIDQKSDLIWMKLSGNYLILNTAYFEEEHLLIPISIYSKRQSELHCINMETGERVWSLVLEDFLFSEIYITDKNLIYRPSTNPACKTIKYIKLSSGDISQRNDYPIDVHITDVQNDDYIFYYSENSRSHGEPLYECTRNNLIHNSSTLKKFDIASCSEILESDTVYYDAAVIIGRSTNVKDPFYINSRLESINHEKTEHLIYAYGCLIDNCEPGLFYECVGIACADKNDLSIIWDTKLPESISFSNNAVFQVEDGIIIINKFDKPQYSIDMESGKLTMIDKIKENPNLSSTQKDESTNILSINDEDGNMIQSALRINKRDDNGNYIDDPICTLTFTKDEWFKLLGEKHKFRDMFHYEDFKIHYIDKDSILFMVGNTLIRYDAPE